MIHAIATAMCTILFQFLQTRYELSAIEQSMALLIEKPPTEGPSTYARKTVVSLPRRPTILQTSIILGRNSVHLQIYEQLVEGPARAP